MLRASAEGGARWLHCAAHPHTPPIPIPRDCLSSRSLFGWRSCSFEVPVEPSVTSSARIETRTHALEQAAAKGGAASDPKLLTHEVDVVAEHGRLAQHDARRVVNGDATPQAAAGVDVHTKRVGRVRLQQECDQLPRVAAPRKVVVSHTRAAQGLDPFIEQIDAEPARRGKPVSARRSISVSKRIGQQQARWCTTQSTSTPSRRCPTAPRRVLEARLAHKLLLAGSTTLKRLMSQATASTRSGSALKAERKIARSAHA